MLFPLTLVEQVCERFNVRPRGRDSNGRIELRQAAHGSITLNSE